MKIQVRYVKSLLAALIRMHNETSEKKGLDSISEQIKGIGESYLYKKIAQPISKLKNTDYIGLRDAKLESLVQHLGYDNAKAFIEAMDSPISKQLESCIGTYYSYIRRNTKDAGVILRSPVRIFRYKNQISMELKGMRLEFVGNLAITNGYMHTLLKSHDEKQFYHGYKIGAMQRPKLLQGIFSGVTSSFDPIGGRVVLIKTEDEYESMRIAELEVETLKVSLKKDENMLAKYFQSYEENNLRIYATTSFTVNDLLTQ